MKSPPERHTALHAYADDQLPPEERARLDALLAQDAEAQSALQDIQRQKENLRTLLDPVLEEPIPLTLLEACRPASAAPRRQPARWPLGQIAAGFLLAMLGGIAGWLGHAQLTPATRVASQSNDSSLPRQAAMAHAVFSPDARRPVEIGAEQEELLVRWLSKRLGADLKPPKLANAGFELIGGRLLSGTSGPVAQFMYQDSSGQRLTLYISRNNSAGRDTAFRFAQEGAVNVFYWIDGQSGYALSASIPKAALADIATAVYEQLEARAE